MTAVVELPNRQRDSWTAAELMAAEFPPPRWAVPGLVAEGVTLLAGSPKVGKSWLGLNLAVSIATGGTALGKVNVETGAVLYLALEDTPRRLKSRLAKVLGKTAAPDALTFATHCEPLTDGGYERISTWLQGHPDARLVVVDVFAKIRGRTPASNVSMYDADYLAMSRLKTLADSHGVAVLVVHHTRKSGSEDFLDTVSGTQGLAGAADAVLVLRRSRGQADATLHVTGRDVDETEYALTFAADLGAWQMLDGPAIAYTLGETRAAILRHLQDVQGATPKQIATALNLDHANVRQTCSRMSEDGQLDTDGRGLYFTSLSHLSPLSLTIETSDTGDTSDSHPEAWQ